MISKWIAFITAGILAISTCGPLLAEMTIRLSDGRTIVLPIDPEQIDAITFSPKKDSVEPQAKNGGASKAAPRLRRSAQKDESLAARAARQQGRPPAKPGVMANKKKTGESALERVAGGRTLKVGPGQPLTRPSQAAKMARDNDVIEIAAGPYSGDVAIWRANNLTIRGVGGRAHMIAAGRAAGGKAIWVIKGSNTTVENVEFSGTRVRDKNGAGIRQEGTNLTVRNSYFHDNEMGILTGRNPRSDILIEDSEFAHNTVDYRRFGRLGHNIYIGQVRSFTLRNSYVHHAIIGHNVKSRAQTNLILYNRIMDEREGGSSYLLDIPNGGATYVVGNLFHQSPRNDNNVMISYAAEGARNDKQYLFVVNNTFVNDDRSGRAVQNRSRGQATIVNNIFVGPGKLLGGPGSAYNNVLARKNGSRGAISSLLFADAKKFGNRLEAGHGNILVRDAGLKDRRNFDYHLKPGSAAIDAGRPLGTDGDISLTPRFEYSDSAKLRPRAVSGALDAGAFELRP